ncbi:PREDICTED: uncharacterized protein LOC108763364 [Trachymyrmex cornetzi]|uniref:uncharacterized protein LOC108763364 n=1 Tax=Trachymyrmex cornetzi TaxID=471704 RepID=UPI00084F6869|nr:PREDICTED: uncharacterized protein LOC108763364 [Trachymyrmex cornetzi]
MADHVLLELLDSSDEDEVVIPLLEAILIEDNDAHNVIRYPTIAEKEETSTYFFQEKGFPAIISNAFTLIFITNILQVL